MFKSDFGSQGHPDSNKGSGTFGRVKKIASLMLGSKNIKNMRQVSNKAKQVVNDSKDDVLKGCMDQQMRGDIPGICE
jgi:hypothetical protein